MASIIDRMNNDTLSVVCSFLSLRCLGAVRLVSHYTEELITGDDFWSVMCLQHGISGTFVEPTVRDDVEPHAWRALDGPREPMESILPWQLFCILWQSVDRLPCEHLTYQDLIDALPAWQVQVASSSCRTEATTTVQHSTSTGGCSQNGCLSPATGGNYHCCRCAKRFCGRSQSQHMPAHASDGQCGVVGTRNDYHDVFCYQCNHCALKTSAFSNNSVPATPPLPTAVLRGITEPRDCRVKRNHMGLFLRNKCPHLDDGIVSHLRLWFAKNKSVVFNSTCQVPSCGSMKPYLCIQCGFRACGAGPGLTGHMQQHAKQKGHCLVIAIRRLDIWCYHCDRYLGVGGVPSDALAADAVRAILCRPKEMSHHQSENPWDFLLNPSGSS
jgi:hypothetical protein